MNIGWRTQAFVGPISAVDEAALTALPAGGTTAWACNTGTKDVMVQFGGPTIGDYSAGGTRIAAGTCRVLNITNPANGQYANHVWVVCPTDNDTSTVTLELGSGDPRPYEIPSA